MATSRKDRLPVASSSADWFPSFDEEDRSKLERAYGRRLSEESWTALAGPAGVVKWFAVDANREHQAAPMDEWFGKLTELKAAAQAFVVAFHAADDLRYGRAIDRILGEEWEAIFAEGAKRDAALDLLDEHVEQALLIPEETVVSVTGVAHRSWPTPSLYDAVDRTNELILTIGRAEERKREGRLETLRPGDAWESLVWELTEWAKAHGYPAQARKDAHLAGQNSPFVQLVEELQAMFPERYRRKANSTAALGVSISRAQARFRVTKTKAGEQ